MLIHKDTYVIHGCVKVPKEVGKWVSSNFFASPSILPIDNAPKIVSFFYVRHLYDQFSKFYFYLCKLSEPFSAGDVIDLRFVEGYIALMKKYSDFMQRYLLEILITNPEEEKISGEVKLRLAERKLSFNPLYPQDIAFFYFKSKTSKDIKIEPRRIKFSDLNPSQSIRSKCMITVPGDTYENLAIVIELKYKTASSTKPYYFNAIRLLPF